MVFESMDRVPHIPFVGKESLASDPIWLARPTTPLCRNPLRSVWKESVQAGKPRCYEDVIQKCSMTYRSKSANSSPHDNGSSFVGRQDITSTTVLLKKGAFLLNKRAVLCVIR